MTIFILKKSLTIFQSRNSYFPGFKTTKKPFLYIFRFYLNFARAARTLPVATRDPRPYSKNSKFYDLGHKNSESSSGLIGTSQNGIWKFQSVFWSWIFRNFQKPWSPFFQNSTLSDPMIEKLKLVCRKKLENSRNSTYLWVIAYGFINSLWIGMPFALSIFIQRSDWLFSNKHFNKHYLNNHT